MTKPTVFVTGVAGNLGLRLLPQLQDFSVIGVDIAPPKTDLPLHFVRIDIGDETSCRVLYHLLRENRPQAVVHLAFVIDPVRTGVIDVERMWQINVAGTARVMEAITEANRNSGLDLVAAVITFFSVRVSDKPADADHQYGHGKVENFSAFIETGLLLLTRECDQKYSPSAAPAESSAPSRQRREESGAPWK